MEKKLYRSNINKKVAGICGGLSDYFEMDATIIRLIFVLLAIFGGGTGLIIYIVLWIVVPRSPYYLPFQQEPFVTPPPAGQPDMNEAKTAQEQQPIFDDVQPIKKPWFTYCRNYTDCIRCNILNKSHLPLLGHYNSSYPCRHWHCNSYK